MQCIIASSAHSHSIADGFPYLAGMLMVMVCLACLWALSAIIARLLRSVMPEKAPVVPTPSTTSPMPAPNAPQVADPETRIPAHIVAVIAAAVASASRQPVRIISIKPTNNAWERAGRQTVLTSHRIR